MQAYFESWLVHRSRGKSPIPKYVEDEFRQYLACGDPEYGMMTAVCPSGDYSRPLPGRCKGRGFCAYCLTLRQRELGSRLIEDVIGNVPLYHAVFCFPPSLRCTLGYDAKLIRGGFRALTAAMFEFQRRVAEDRFGVSRDRIHPGCVGVHHRMSANLKPNHHIHGLFPDGVFIEAEPGQLEFRRLPPPSEEDIAGIAHEAGLIFCKVLKSRGFWEAKSTSPDTIEGVLKLPGTRPIPVKFFGQAARYGEGGTKPRDGAYAFHLFVSKAIELEERPQLHHLVNYILAPPFRDDQVQQDEAGNVVLRFKRERHDGTGYEAIKPYDFLDRLAELVPRPNTNSLRYYGIYGARARLRRQAVELRLKAAVPVDYRHVGLMECPVCGQELRVISGVNPHRGGTSAIPPDTPRALIPGGGGGGGQGDDHGVQGRLFANTG